MLLLAPLGKEAKELLADKSALLLLAAGASVVAAAFGAIAGRPTALALGYLGTPPALGGLGGVVGGKVGAAFPLELATAPAMAPPRAAAPATPTIGPQMAALLSFLTGAHG